MAFKTKTKTRQIVNDRQTLDAKHNNILQSFTENKTNITDLKHELSKIISILHPIPEKFSTKDFANCPMPPYGIKC